LGEFCGEHDDENVRRDHEATGQFLDDTSLTLLGSLLSRGKLTEIFGPVSTGKEAVVLRARTKEGDCALKVYRLAPSFRATNKYFSADPRYENPKIAKMRSDRRSIVMEWARREHHNLMVAHDIGLPVAEPFFSEGNILAMEFLGREGVPFPTLQKSAGGLRDGGQDVIQEVWRQVHETLLLMAKHSFVHGDLSPFNILYDEETSSISLIDISQSYVSREIWTEGLFKADVQNVGEFFRKLGVQIDPLSLYEELMRRTHPERGQLPAQPMEVTEELCVVVPSRGIACIAEDRGLLAELEERSGARIRIEGSRLWIESSSPEGADAVKRVLDATARGFPNGVALRLLYPDVRIESIHARSMLRSKKKARRQVGRIIGREGEIKLAIEKHSGAAISIRGSKINLIGTALQIQLATGAIERIMKGYAQEDSLIDLKEYEKGHYLDVHPLWGNQ